MILLSFPLPLILIVYFLPKSFVICYVIFNYLMAVFLFYKMSKYYFPNMEKISPKEKQYFHEDYPTFNRTELSSIHFGRIFYGMLNYYWFKAILGVFVIFIMWVKMKIHFIGRNIFTCELTKEDREFVKTIGSGLVTRLYKVMGLRVEEENWVNKEEVLKEYRNYLGKDYNPEEYKDKFTTVIANHTSWADIFYLMSKFSSSFISKDSMRKLPLMGYVSLGFKTIYINRTSQDSRLEVLNKLAERQKMFAEGKSLFPLTLFPEGTVGNGRNIMSFRKGAFYTLLPIKLFVIKVNNQIGNIPASGGIMNMFLHISLVFTHPSCTITAIELPVFAPNDYLYEHFEHLGKDKAEIFSEACRHIMAKLGGFELSNSNFATKLNYMSIVKRKEIKNT